MIGVSRQLPNRFGLSVSKLTLDVTIRGTAEHAERDFENRDIRAKVQSLHPSTADPGGWFVFSIEGNLPMNSRLPG
jgi:hypothetical protein